MRSLALVFVGSGLGGVLRYALGLVVVRLGGVSALSTFLVNVIGTFIAVLVAQWLTRHIDLARAVDVRAFVSIGLLGGFTTYSAFSVDIMMAASSRAWGTSALILVGTVLACLASGALALFLSNAS
jgi:fluoride exporter